ncbi:MAG: ABC transporter ATP-binding protein [Candidatus Borkfalkiaceae bacterium]|nr:ABC transporter ATP-binding protein [Christensenellaceae bacterium]
MKKKANSGVIKKLWKYAYKYRFAFVLSLITAALYVAGSLYLPKLYGEMTNFIVGKNDVDLDGILSLGIRAAAIIAAAALMQWITEAVCVKISDGVARSVRRDLFGKIQKLPLKYIDGRPTGDILSVEIGDVDRLADGMLLGFSRFFTGILTIIGTLAFMVSINPIIAVCVALITPLSLFTAKFITGRTYNRFKAQAEITGRQTSLVEETLSAIPTVKANLAENKFGNDFDKVNDELKDCSFKAVFYSSLTNPTTRFINAVVYAVVACVGALIAVKGSPTGAFAVTAGSLVSLLSYANRYTKPFNEITSVLTEITGAKACADRIFKVLDEDEEIIYDGEKQAETLQGKVDFKDVYFSYDPSFRLIQDFNLSVNPGEKVAIVGPTGCGKTTLINLIMRFYDVTSGEIDMDGIPSKQIERKSLRRNIGMVLQDTWIRKARVKDNVAIGNPNATQEEIEEACKRAHCHGFISRLPDGYDTIIGEEGLSQGQKQLISIARVMLCLPPVLILDEATSNIDTRTEMKIQKAFYELTAGKTSFMVAHRLSTIRSADLILVMKDGNVIEQGKHAELLEKKGFYYQLYNSQFEK